MRRKSAKVKLVQATKCYDCGPFINLFGRKSDAEWKAIAERQKKETQAFVENYDKGKDPDYIRELAALKRKYGY